MGRPSPGLHRPRLSAEEKEAYDRLVYFYTRDLAYALEMATRPQTLYGIADSPVGMPHGFSRVFGSRHTLRMATWLLAGLIGLLAGSGLFIGALVRFTGRLPHRVIATVMGFGAGGPG